MTAEDDRIPAMAEYRGVEIHDNQPPERIERTVIPEIDEVLSISDPQLLFDFACDRSKCPEARLLASAKVEAVAEQHAAGRRAQGVDVELLRAHVAGLGSIRWRDPRFYDSALSPPPGPGESHSAVRRERALRD